jgi:hypothetical protein
LVGSLRQPASLIVEFACALQSHHRWGLRALSAALKLRNSWTLECAGTTGDAPGKRPLRISENDRESSRTARPSASIRIYQRQVLQSQTWAPNVISRTDFVITRSGRPLPHRPEGRIPRKKRCLLADHTFVCLLACSRMQACRRAIVCVCQSALLTTHELSAQNFKKRERRSIRSHLAMNCQYVFGSPTPVLSIRSLIFND